MDMPVPVSNYTIAKLTDGTGVGLYIFGGRDSAGACTTTVQVYYPDTNTTAVLAADPFAGTVNGATVFPGGVVAVGNKGYAWGGFCGGTTSPYTGSQTWIFDPAAAAGSRWTAGPNLPAPGAYQNGAVLDGKIYSIGGDSFDGAALTAYADVLMLDPANLGAGWQAKAPIPTPSSGVPGCDESRAFGFDTASGWSLAGKIVLAGCGQWDQTPTALPDSFLYDGATNTWASVRVAKPGTTQPCRCVYRGQRDQRPDVGRRWLCPRRHQHRHGHDRDLPGRHRPHGGIADRFLRRRLGERTAALAGPRRSAVDGRCRSAGSAQACLRSHFHCEAYLPYLSGARKNTLIASAKRPLGLWNPRGLFESEMLRWTYSETCPIMSYLRAAESTSLRRTATCRCHTDDSDANHGDTLPLRRLPPVCYRVALSAIVKFKSCDS